MNSETQSEVLVVIPNYNGEDYLKKCLQSVLDQTYSSLKIVLVDNASTDNSLSLVKREFPTIEIIETGYNAGWGIACNLGMKASNSPYILMLNNDAFMDQRCIEEMVKAISTNPKYGACASRVLLSDEPDKTEVCGLVIHRDGSSCGRGRLGPADQFMKTEEVFCANDCCALFKREMFNEIGDYDPDFFIYCDETDIGWKHQLAGWKCIYTPHAIAYHAHSAIAGSYTEFKAFHVERNRLYLCMKYFPLFDFLMSFIHSAYRYLYQVYLSGSSKKGALAHYRKENSLLTGLGVLLRAHFSAFSKFPIMWKRRQDIKKITKLSYAEFNDLFKRFGITTKEMASYE